MPIYVPSNMSSVDAFSALYQFAKEFRMGQHSLSAGEPPGSPWNAIQIFKTYCPSAYCEYVRGKYMKVDFRKFPEIDTDNYDRHYGEGAAKKAIQSYQKTAGLTMGLLDAYDLTAPEENYDLNCKPCTYFTSFWKGKTPEYQRIDLEKMFTQCERLEEAEKRIEKQTQEVSSSRIFDECKARYTVASPKNNYPNDEKSCQEALNHLETLSQIKTHEYRIIKDLSVCRYNSYLPFLKRCQKESEISLDTARKILEFQNSKA